MIRFCVVFCKKSTVFFNSYICVKIGKFFVGQNSSLKMNVNKMLKWRRREMWERSKKAFGGEDILDRFGLTRSGKRL